MTSKLMNRDSSQPSCMLAIAPSTRGFGYVVFESSDTLIDWAVKTARGDKNTQSIKGAAELIQYFKPGKLILQDLSKSDCRRALRIRQLSGELIALAKRSGVKVCLHSFKQIRKAFFGDELGTKYEIAEILTKRFPEELGPRLPPKRRAWMSEDSRMDIFDAVALAVVHMEPSTGKTG